MPTAQGPVEMGAYAEGYEAKVVYHRFSYGGVRLQPGHHGKIDAEGAEYDVCAEA